MYTVLHTVHEDCMKTFTRLRRDVQSEIRWLGRGTDAVHKVLVEEVAATSPDAVAQVRIAALTGVDRGRPGQGQGEGKTMGNTEPSLL